MNTKHKKTGGSASIGLQQLVILLNVLVLLFLLAATALLFITGRSITNSYMEDVGSATLNYYESQLNYTLQTIEDFCENNISQNSSFEAYDNTKGSVKDYELKLEVGRTLSSLVQQSRSIYFAMSCPVDGNEAACMYRSRCKTLNERDILRDEVLRTIASDDSAFLFNRWEWVKVDQAYYLRNIYRFENVYCAVYLDTSILSSPKEHDSTYYLLCRQGDQLISDNKDVQSAVLTQSDRIDMNGSSYTLLSVPSQKGDFSVCCLITSTAAALRQNVILLCIVLPLLILGLYFGGSVILRHLFHLFSTLNQACVRVASGDLSTGITRSGHFVEEKQIYQAFNDMMQQIKDLRITLYEQKLAAQQSKLQFLRVQIKSHFFVNCLNVIHSLAMIGNTELIQEFTLYLSDYFRYLGSGFSDTVRFSLEFSHLQNYIKIHEIRYPGRISCRYQVTPEVEDFEILPMIPQTIVENIFKHVLGVQDTIRITIQAQIGKYNETRGMWLSIADNGPGFSDEQLKTFNMDAVGPNPPDEGGTGISNTKNRLYLFYKEQTAIRFENAPSGGAVVKIFFPALEHKEDEPCEPY